jgi:NAD(P)-dependent dehydrogenase (short-subunit alcohol dehydrogenase family)
MGSSPSSGSFSVASGGGRSVLVTGGQGGIGSAIAEALAARGATVYVARHPGSAIPDRAAGGATVHHLELDVTSERDWDSALARIESAQGALYGLVNNAAVLEPGTDFLDLDLAEWRRQLSVNLDGSFLGCRSAMRMMARTGGGAIVNVSSGAALIPSPKAAAYCVSKAAVLALTRLAAKAGGRHRVRVNAVLPGAVDTPMLWRNVREGDSPVAFVLALTRLHPIGRIGMPTDVAAAVAFLLDPANDFTTGALLSVDGGQVVD